MPKIIKKRGIISREEVIQMINDADSVFAGDEEKITAIKALVAYLYLAGSRISEALTIKRKDVWTDKNFLNVKVKVLKRKDSFDFEIILPLPTDKEEIFTDLIIEKAKRTPPNEKMWDFDRTTAWRYLTALNQTIYPHLFRHTRATMFADKGAADSQLRAWFGWTDGRPATKYIQRSSKQVMPLAEMF